MRCLGPFFHKWGKWVDGDMTIRRMLTMGDGVPAELWGTFKEFNRVAQSRVCEACGRKQIRYL